MRPKLKPFEFKVRVSVLGSTRERAWKSLLRIMDKAGFTPKPTSIDKLTKSLTKKGKSQ